MVNSVESEIFNFQPVRNCPLYLKRLIFFLGKGRGGGGQGTVEHRLEAVFKCTSEHAVSHALQAEQTGLPIRSPASVTKWEKVNISNGCSHQTNFDM